MSVSTLFSDASYSPNGLLTSSTGNLGRAGDLEIHWSAVNQPSGRWTGDAGD